MLKLVISVMLLMACISLSSAQSIEIRAEDGGSLPDSIPVGETFTVLITENGNPVGETTHVIFALPADGDVPIYSLTDENGKARYLPLITGTLSIRVLDDDLVTVAEATVDVTVSGEVPLNITSFTPSSPVADTEGAARTFSITVNQIANVSWLINGTEAQTNESVTSAAYTNASATPGVWNVSAIANNTNGTVIQTWWWIVLANTPSPPAITSWSNDKTNNDSLHITLNESESVHFNATADQTITTWNWSNNGAVQSNTCDNYTTSWSVNGTYTVSVNATNANGTSDTKTWTVTVNVAEPSPCYIATATYGTPLDKNIDILRDFRDELLLTNPIGEAFVSTYYRTSPPIADALRENDGLRTVTRLTLITPLVYLSKSLLSGILVICIFIIGLTAVFLTKTERMKIMRPLLAGTGSILVFIAAIFSLGFIGYAIPFCAAVGAYMLPLVIPLSAVFTICTVLKMRANVSDNIKKYAWNSKA